MNKLFFYPKVNLSLTNSPNPYILNLEKTISPYFEIVNRGYNKGGVLEFFQYFSKTDSYLFNWIEDLPIYRYGKIQVLFFSLFLILAKIGNKKIVWILHNKYSHFRKKNRWTDFMYWMMVKYSNSIITHSQEGVDFVKQNFTGHERKVKYLIHPMEPLLPTEIFECKIYDLLIWGAIHPYKGIYEFLKFLKDNHPNNSIRILIVGKAFDKAYYYKLTKLMSRNISHLNEFKSIEEIAKFAQASKFVFFPYNSPSLLSSGTLMDSLRMRSNILAPNLGSFKDLSYLSNVLTYNGFEDVVRIIDAQKFDINSNRGGEIDNFYAENSWARFGSKFHETFELAVKR